MGAFMSIERDVVYLGSQSISRQTLLQEAGIPFVVLSHTSTEQEVVYTGDIEKYVLAIAQGKMQSLVMPEQTEKPIFVLTADTMVLLVETGQLFGKPKDIEDAYAMLAAMYCKPVRVVTGCCLEKRVYQDGCWQVSLAEHFVVGAEVQFNVHAEDRAEYFKRLPQALYSCGAGIVEDFGANFVESVRGSYSTITGLPLYELRHYLKKLNFIF